MASIKLVSLNIERSKHLDLVVPFLKAQKPEIATIQECMDRDIPILEEALGAKCFYAPLCEFKERADEPRGVYGQAIFFKYPFTSTREEYYSGSRDALYLFGDDKEVEINQVARALSVVEFEKEDAQFRIATTHFTWSPDGSVTDLQRQDLAALCNLLDGLDEFVLSGDFNAPRGKEIFDTLAARYRDNIPPQYLTSIDANFHRNGKIRPGDFVDKMVDGLFTTPKYIASNVELHAGVSDHMAITATITKL